MKSPLRWPGGKGRLAPVILQYVPPHEAYVETCCGGAAVFWAKPREWSKAEILNDADGELINFYYVLHKQGRKLAREVDSLPYSRALFSKVLRSKPTSTFRRAVRFWYLDRVAFGAKQTGQSFGVQIRRYCTLPHRILRDLDATIERIRGVVFESLHVLRLLTLYDRRRTLFYVDPPYYGLSQPYACLFGQRAHEALAAAVAAVEGSVLLTYNDCPEVRRLYRPLRPRRLACRYMIGSNSRRGGGPGDGAQLLISNRPLRRVKHK